MFNLIKKFKDNKKISSELIYDKTAEKVLSEVGFIQEIVTSEDGNTQCIKFSNGFMIAIGQITTGEYNSASCVSAANWNLPVDFTNTKYYISFGQASGGNSTLYSALANNVSVNQIHFQLKGLNYSGTPSYISTANRPIYCFAIGMWK